MTMNNSHVLSSSIHTVAAAVYWQKRKQKMLLHKSSTQAYSNGRVLGVQGCTVRVSMLDVFISDGIHGN